MPNYHNGQIYMIWSPHTDKVYIGSTTQPLHKRFYDHCHGSANKRTTANTIIDCGDAKIELIEAYPCESKSELDRREGQIIRERNCVNKVVAGRTAAEYRQEKKDEIAKRMKAYRQIPEVKAHTSVQKKEYEQRPEVKARRNELARSRYQQRRKEEQAAA
jgi:predicted GIY-YIG superfamily endonuclease